MVVSAAGTPEPEMLIRKAMSIDKRRCIPAAAFHRQRSRQEAAPSRPPRPGEEHPVCEYRSLTPPNGIYTVDDVGAAFFVARQYPAILRARRKTSVSIFSVSLPVEVFCWLGW